MPQFDADALYANRAAAPRPSVARPVVAGVVVVLVAVLMATLLPRAFRSSSTAGSGHGPITFEIFMKVNAGSTDVAAVHAVLRHSPEVVRTRFVSRAMAFRTFQCLLRDQPDLVATVKVTDLPESFRVTVERPVDARRLARRIRAVPGVSNVEVPLSQHDLLEEQKLRHAISAPRLPRPPTDRVAERCRIQP